MKLAGAAVDLKVFFPKSLNSIVILYCMMPQVVVTRNIAVMPSIT